MLWVNDLEGKLRFYFKALNAFDLKSVEEMFAEEAVYASSGLGATIKGRAKIMKAFHVYFAEFNDQVSIDENIAIVSPLTLNSRWRLIATSNKTSQRIHRSGMQITKFNAAGLIIHIEVSDDK